MLERKAFCYHPGTDHYISLVSMCYRPRESKSVAAEIGESFSKPAASYGATSAPCPGCSMNTDSPIIVCRY